MKVGSYEYALDDGLRHVSNELHHDLDRARKAVEVAEYEVQKAVEAKLRIERYISGIGNVRKAIQASKLVPVKTCGASCAMAHTWLVDGVTVWCPGSPGSPGNQGGA